MTTITTITPVNFKEYVKQAIKPWYGIVEDYGQVWVAAYDYQDTYAFNRGEINGHMYILKVVEDIEHILGRVTYKHVPLVDWEEPNDFVVHKIPTTNLEIIALGHAMEYSYVNTQNITNPRHRNERNLTTPYRSYCRYLKRQISPT